MLTGCVVDGAMIDKDGIEIRPGDPVTFYSANRKATLLAEVVRHVSGQIVSVRIKGDPFDVNVPLGSVKYAPSESLRKDSSPGKVTKSKQGEPMTTATKPSSRELRLKAKELKIPGWQELDRKGLISAIKKARTNGSAAEEKPAKRVSKAEKKARIEERAAARSGATKSAPAKKAAAVKKSTPKAATRTEATSESTGGDNPFRSGSNMWRFAEELIRGGKRKDMVKRLKRQISMHPYSKRASEMNVDFELDKRLMLTSQTMVKEHGFTVERDGRGLEGTIKVSKASGRRRRS